MCPGISISGDLFTNNDCLLERNAIYNHHRNEHVKQCFLTHIIINLAIRDNVSYNFYLVLYVYCIDDISNIQL